MAKRKLTLSGIAKKLVAKYPELTEIVNENEKSYKALEPKITTRLCGMIGKAEEQYVKRNDLIWAVINEVKGDVETDALEW